MDELIIGTYQGFLLGYSHTSDENQKLNQTFAIQSHTGSVRCLTMGGKFLASGGTDDKIVVIDLVTRKEHTVLMHHDGTVNTLSFTNGGTHLISGSDDGSLVVTRVGNWQIEKIWKKAHGGQPVSAVTVHPSDKLAFTIGGDKTLRTWNLVKGRPAFTINLSSKGISLASDIMFAQDADRFSLISQQSVDIWTISKAGIEKRITCNSKPVAMQWINNDKIVVGLENGNIIMMNVSDSKAVTCNAHKQRVKCMYYENDVLYSASSTGEIKVWSLSEPNTLTELTSISAGGRVTCMSLNRQNYLIKKEDNSDTEKDETENKDDVKGSSDEALNEDEIGKKRPAGAYVSISYNQEAEVKEPPKKKRKGKKRNKKQKN